MNKEDWPKLDAAVKCSSGFLVDRDIATAVEKGQLISLHPQLEAAKYASYEMHIGDRIEQLVLDKAPGKESDIYRGKDVTDAGICQINPGETCKIYSAEELYIPADVFAITIPVGNMYKLGLCPETSFADPGWVGTFYVTVCNYSPRIVKLKVGDPLARVFFFKLSDRPEQIHDQKPRELPPSRSVERVPVPNHDTLVTQGEAALIADVLSSVTPPHYQHAFVTQRMFVHHREATNLDLTQLHRKTAVVTVVSFLSFFVVLLMAALFVARLLLSRWPTFSEGTFASLAAAGIWALCALLIGSFRTSLRDAITTLLKQ